MNVEGMALVKRLPAFPDILSSFASTHVILLTTASVDPCTQVHNLTLRHTQLHIIKNKIKSLKRNELTSGCYSWNLNCLLLKWSDLNLLLLGLRLRNPRSYWPSPAWGSGMCREACTAKPGSFFACYFTMLQIKVFRWLPTWNLVEVNSE